MTLRYLLLNKPGNIDEFVAKAKKIFGEPRFRVSYQEMLIDEEGNLLDRHSTILEVVSAGGREIAEAKVIAYWREETLPYGLPPAEFDRETSRIEQLKERSGMEFIVAREEVRYSMFGAAPDRKRIENRALNAATYLKNQGIPITINNQDPDAYRPRNS